MIRSQPAVSRATGGGIEPTRGASLLGGGRCRFSVWAPAAQRIDVRLVGGGERIVPLQRYASGLHESKVRDVAAGDLYFFRLDGRRDLPDPQSRFQPHGVHGPSQVIDPDSFQWSDGAWRGIPLNEAAIYELHVGTFTPEGTFAGAASRIPYLKELGITVIELMPLADFPGRRGWGYDGVSLFAPARCYGTPDDLRALVNAAHRAGLALALDVVWNHLGPDGNYLGSYSADYFNQRRNTPWGPAVNFDGPESAQVREFFIENAVRWIKEYHFDGLRFDATHSIYDDSPRHIVAEAAARAREAAAPRRLLLIAEDHRNLSKIVKPESAGGWGLDAVWADDFHHEVRRLLAGDCDGYFADFSGTAEELAGTIKKGWLFTGQYSKYFRAPRGSEPAGLEAGSRVFFIQNHDQVGNRAMGERLNHQVDPAAYRAATMLLLCCPETPLIFMGQEWAAGSPFEYFTDHHPELGKKVTEGRRREFARFEAFSAPQTEIRIPDPQGESAFRNSRLAWSETGTRSHASVLNLYRACLELRKSQPSLRRAERIDIAPVGESAVAFKAKSARGPATLVVTHLKHAGRIDLKNLPWSRARHGHRWEVVLSTENPRFSPHPRAPVIDYDKGYLFAEFARPGAFVAVESRQPRACAEYRAGTARRSSGKSPF